MKILIVSGSPREKSQSLIISEYIKFVLESKFDVRTLILDIAEHISIEEDYFTLSESQYLTEQAIKADGFVFVSPEYSGMVPPAAKQWFLKIGANAIAHKPVLLIGVSSGIGGTYPIVELRASATKNNRILPIPEHVIVRNVCDNLFDENSSIKGAANISNRIDHACHQLKEYSLCFIPIRKKLIIKDEVFYGM